MSLDKEDSRNNEDDGVFTKKKFSFTSANWGT
jgi:hypothetical protein